MDVSALIKRAYYNISNEHDFFLAQDIIIIISKYSEWNRSIHSMISSFLDPLVNEILIGQQSSKKN
jgi:hypothetical protein